MATKFYPTPSTTTYYINEYLIDDMFRLDFKRTQRHQPIYGYSRTKYDFVARGKELVTGQIIINYRYPGYLRNAIRAQQIHDEKTADRMHQAGLIKSEHGEKAYAVSIMKKADEFSTREDKIKYLANFLLDRELGLLTKNDIARGIVDNVDINPGPTLSPDQAFEILKSNYEKRYFGGNPAEENPSIMSSPLDDKPMPFDITVRYGLQDTPGGYVRTFRDIHLIGEEQVVSAQAGVGDDQSSSAQPILEIYPFFCRTIDVRSYKG